MTVTTKTLGTCECTFDETTGVLVIGAGELPDFFSPIYEEMEIHRYSILSVASSGKVKLAEAGSLMFSDCTNLTSLDASSWDTSNVTDMRGMFFGCTNLTSLDASSWDTSNVTDMSWMFEGCTNLTSLDASSWDTSNVIDMRGMFSDCTNLTSLDASSWDTSNVTDMSLMFEGCTNLTSLDASSWDTSNVTDMSWMFEGCTNLTSLALGSKFVTSQLKNSRDVSIVTAAPASNVSNKITVNSDAEFFALTPAQKAGVWKLKIPITAVFNADNDSAGLAVSCTYSGATGTATLSMSYAHIGSTSYADGGSATSTTGSVELLNESAPTDPLSLLLWLSDTAGNTIYYRTTTVAADPIMALDGEGNLTAAGTITGTDVEATGNLTVSGTGTFGGVNGSTNEFIVYAAQTSATQYRWVFTNAGNIRMEKSTDSGKTWTTQGWYARDTKGGRSLLDGIYPVGAVYISYVSTSPASLFGGSWTQITGRFLRMANDVDTGGADSITHRHRETIGADEGTLFAQTAGRAGTTVVSNVTHSNGVLYKAGTVSMRLDDTYDTTTNNRPAYQDLYAWRRTA